MDIIGTNMTEKERKNKKLIKIIAIIIALLLIISLLLFGAIYYLKVKEFKLRIDGKTILKTSISSDLFVYEGDLIYVSLKDISELIGYKYYNGGYKQYSEDITKCYLECNNEVATFEKDSNTIYKTPTDEVDYTYYTIDEPTKRINGKLYVTTKSLSTACNVQIAYNKKTNLMTIYTLPYLTNYYITKYSNAAIEDNFNNQKALLYGLLVVQNVANTDTSSSSRDIRYGIHTLSNEEIVGMKYTNIEFTEGSQEFIVKTTENKVGIITSEGNTKVSPQYDKLKQIDKDLNLYLATNNGKSGVIEKNGKILIYLEYEKIGIDTTKFPTNDIKNKYILFDNAIPVKQNGKWGLFDIRGNMLLPIEFIELGCVSRTSSDKTLNNILIIPEIEGIVVCKQYEIDKKKVQYYGIYSSTGKELVPIALETVYSITVGGQEEYTMINNGNSFNVIEFVKQQFPEQEDITNTNTTTEETATTVNEEANVVE